MARFFAALNRSRNLRTRFASALILGPGFVAAVYAGGLIFQIVVVVGALVAFHEWGRLTAATAEPAERWVPLGLIPFPLIGAVIWGPQAGLTLIALLSAGVVGFLRAFGRSAAAHAGFGVLYVSLPAFSVLWLRDRPDAGMVLLLWLCATVWATDVAAYASGRLIGGPKLAPSISPAKTWAGLVGGMLGAVLAGGLVSDLAGWEKPGMVMVVSGGLAVLAQLGDLFESSVKRQFGVKDSGMLIPGHGGILDRMDGFLAAAPATALLYAACAEQIGW